MKRLLLVICFFSFVGNNTSFAQKGKIQTSQKPILAGADQLTLYLPVLEGKKVGIFANQTSMIGKKHLVDSLISLGIKIHVIFGPEHGFRGTADAGEKVGNYIDEKTGIPVVSLYGPKRRPDKNDLEEVDIMIFDIQDVGVRFYTFISSLEAYLESAIEYKKPLIVLDRPNPNGFYVDGPVLDTKYRSFIGMQPVPIVYGLTIGEYARMLLGEGWMKKEKKENAPETSTSKSADPLAAYIDLPNAEKSGEKAFFISSCSTSDKLTNKSIRPKEFSLIVICCANYSHKSRYELPVRPSPNLPNIQSIYLYPSTCFFEGTSLSEGRGTDKPFQVFGHPSLPKTLYKFTPAPNEGAKKSKHYGVECYGWDLSGTPAEVLKKTDNKIQLKWLLEAYRLFPEKDSFFLKPKSGDMAQSFFTKLAGNNDLWQQIRDGKTEAQIRKSWEPALKEYKAIRKKYLLYEDFE
jgi:uncharacterized protein YbbC (DUF1343 family)